MELYILQMGKSADAAQLTKVLQRNDTFTAEEKQQLSYKYRLVAWMHLAIASHAVNSKCIYPITLRSMLQEYRGLSRIGRGLAASVGLAPSLRATTI